MECRDYVRKTNAGASLHLVPDRHRWKDHESFLALEVREREQQHHQQVTAMQKDLEVAESLVQTSSEQNQEHLNKITSLSEEKSMLCEKIAKSGKMSLSMKDSTPSEQPEAVFNVEFFGN